MAYHFICGNYMSYPLKCRQWMFACSFLWCVSFLWKQSQSMLEKFSPSFLSPATVWREPPPQSLLLTFNNMELTYNLPEGHQSGEPDNRRSTRNAATLPPLSRLQLFSSQLNANELRFGLFTSSLISSVLTFNCIFYQSSLSLFLFYSDPAACVNTKCKFR